MTGTLKYAWLVADMVGELLTTGQAAKELGVSIGTLRRWTADKKVPCVRTPGNQRRYRKEDLERVYAPEGGES